MEWIASLISEQKCSIINSEVWNGWKCMRNAFVRRELKVVSGGGADNVSVFQTKDYLDTYYIAISLLK